MELTRKVRRLCKIVSRQQSAGIKPGDICPRCGRPTMEGLAGDGYLNDFGVYVCGACAIDVSLAELTGEDTSITTWAVARGQSEPPVPASNSPQKTEIVPKCRKGDRIIDSKTEWPGTVLQVMQTGGLYEVLPDGKNQEAIVLKDREITLEMDCCNAKDYLDRVREIFQTGERIQIWKVTTTPGDNHAGKSGTILGVAEDAGVQVEFDSGDRLTIHPYTDLCSLLGSAQPDIPQYQETEENTVVIDF